MTDELAMISGRTTRHHLAAVIAVIGCVAGGKAGAVEPLAHDLWIDIPVTAVGGIGWIGSEAAFKSALAPAAYRWCDRDTAGKDTLNGFDAAGRSLRWSNTQTPDLLSGLGAFVLLPATVFDLDAIAAHRDAELEGWWLDALMRATHGISNTRLPQSHW